MQAFAVRLVVLLALVVPLRSSQAANEAPQVDAGPDLSLVEPDRTTWLAGLVSDDGLGDPAGTLDIRWSVVEGPGSVRFEPDAYQAEVSVTLEGGVGFYVLALTATDGLEESTDWVTLTLESAPDLPTVVINEVQPAGVPGGPDVSDWIELFNSGPEPVDLAGTFLTDRTDEPAAWRFPLNRPGATTISSRGFLRVWAGAGPEPGLHCDFKLDRGGETVVLTARDGRSEIDRVRFNSLPGGVAWGRRTDGGPTWTTLDPSPAASNVGHALPVVADTTFSVDRGFFDTAFDVVVACATPGATLVYTTDGSRPSPTHGSRGSSPLSIAIKTTTVLRAMAFRDGWHPTDVDTQTYLFLADVIHQPAEVPGYPRPWTWLGGSKYAFHDYEMDPAIVESPAYREEIIPALRALPTMSIAVDPAALADEKGFYWDRGEAPCSLELIVPEDPNRDVQADAGIEPHSHDRMKRSLRLNFRSEYGDAKLDTDLIRRGSLFGASATDTFDRLILRAGNNRSWARVWNPDKTTYAIDQFYRDSQVAMSGYGSRGAFVHLYINGLYWGLYNPVERTDQWFTSAYFGGEPEDWFAIHHGSQNRPGFNGDSTRYETLMNDLIKRDQSDPAVYGQTCAFIDVENFCDYLLFTWWMGVGDWPGNNWYAGCRTDTSPLGPTPLRFFAWDGEWSWDASRAGGPGGVNPEFRSSKTSGKSPISKIWHALRHNPDFMTLFADRTYRHCFHDGALAEPVAQERWLRINAGLRSAVVAESARWGDTLITLGQRRRTRDDDWQPEVDRIHDMIAGNTSHFVAALRHEGYYPPIDPPRLSQRGGHLEVGQTVSLENPNGRGIVRYTLDGTDPRSGGAVASSPISLPHSAVLNARIQDDDTWSALETATFAVGPVAETLSISELLYHPAGDPNTEFVELTNIGSESLDLRQVRFVAGIRFEFPAWVLTPGARVLVVRDLDAFIGRYGPDLPVAGVYEGHLDNGGERVTLLDAVGDPVQSFRYRDSWYPTTDGGGAALEVRDPSARQDLNDAAAWLVSSRLGGTPGR